MSERWWDVTNQRWAGGPDSRDTEIDRLRAELAEAYRAYALDADEVRLELHNAEAAIARVRELCNRAVFTRQHMLPESTVRDAIERNEK